MPEREKSCLVVVFSDQEVICVEKGVDRSLNIFG